MIRFLQNNLFAQKIKDKVSCTDGLKEFFWIKHILLIKMYNRTQLLRLAKPRTESLTDTFVWGLKFWLSIWQMTYFLYRN